MIPLPSPALNNEPLAPPSNRRLLGRLLWLALPVMAEQILHMVVGLTDVYLANHLRGDAAAATAAVGTIAYILWFIGMIVGAIGTGSTAIIARAVGARHRSLANSVCGQSVTAALILGIFLAAFFYLAAGPLSYMTGLSAPAREFALIYLRLLCISLPFSTVMFIAGASLRGAGDTFTPAAAMIVVDLVNIMMSFSLVYGWWGLPEMGFEGIAIGTVIAYIVGGVMLFIVLSIGKGGIRLHWHRLRPHWMTLKRLLRIGLPAGMEGLLTWVAQFIIVIIINGLDPTSAMAAAHINAIRIESISFLSGWAFATAAATLVGQSLGRKDPQSAARSAYLAYAVGGGLMTACGVIFILFGGFFARLLSNDPHIADLTAQCLFLTGFVQCGFAASLIFSGALRGAGDTFVIMLINMASVIGVRLIGVLIVGWWLGHGLIAIWMILVAELMIRGIAVYIRFLQGGWRKIEV